MKQLTIDYAVLLLNQYLKETGIKENTRKTDNVFIKIYRKFLEERGIKDLKETDERTIEKLMLYLEEYVSKRTEKRLAKRTKLKILLTVKKLYKALVFYEKIMVNPCQELDLKKLQDKGRIREIFSVEEMILFLDSIDLKENYGLRDKAMYELMYSSGLRVSEVSNLKIKEIDIKERMAVIRQGKFRKDRIVAISEVALAYLKKYIGKKKNEEEKVFKIAKKQINIRLKKYLKREGIYREGLSAHSIRHSCATHLLSRGAGIRYVQELLGHESIETTVSYTHCLEDNLKKIYRSYHPRENEYYEEIDEKYQKEIEELKERIEKQREKKQKRKLNPKWYNCKLKKRVDREEEEII